PSRGEPMSARRQRRVQDQFRAIVSELILREVQDPRIRHVQITAVRVSPDLREATFFYTLFPGGEADRTAAQAALEHARGFLRRELGRRVRLRATPQLSFRPDRGAAHAAHIEEVLHEIHPPDADAPTPSA